MTRIGALAVAALVAAGLAACAAPNSGEKRAMDPAAAVAALAEEAWQEQLRQSVYLQVKQGLLVRELPDLTPEQAAADLRFARSLLDRIAAIPSGELAPQDALTLAVLRFDAEGTVAAEPYYWLRFPVTPYVAGWSLNFAHQAMASHPFDEPDEHTENYLGLLGEYADALDQMQAHLEGQGERGIYLPRPALPGIAGLFRSFREGVRARMTVSPERLAALSEEGHERFAGQVEETIGGRVLPAFDALLAVLESDAYRSAASEDVGLARYPDGEAYYRHLVRRHTTMDVTPEELHELGERRVAELQAEMEAIRAEVGFRGTQAEFHDALRRDPRFLARTPEEVEARFREYIARIEPLVPRLFSRTPQAPYGVRRLDPAAEATMTFGYYNPPTPAEPKGIYYYNGSRLGERSLVFAGPLIFHELVPGHHFHLALQSENEALPLYRREYLGAGAFNEGWGNYGAFLAREQGLLDDPYDRYGWAIFDMFISARLVVDTGMNLLGWSLEDGRDFMRRHTFQSETEILTESLRYSTDLHGQALAYKAGLEKLLELRRRARELAGDDFSLKAFHDAVLGSGALPLTVLEEHLERVLTPTGRTGGGGPSH